MLGSIQDGLTDSYTQLATKSVLDGFASIALAAGLGWGVGIAALTVLVVQGAITLGAGAFLRRGVALVRTRDGRAGRRARPSSQVRLSSQVSCRDP